jgi:hypothetical protein
MDNRNFVIGILSTTAVMLLVGLIVVNTRPVPARADSMTVVSGDYVLTVGGLTQIDEDMLYVIDNPEAKMIVYRFDTRRGKIAIVQGIDLAEIRKAAEEAGKSPAPTRDRR